MENFERVAGEILSYINDGVRIMTDLLLRRGARFILCGSSGSGKTRAVDFVNKRLPEGQQIAESHDMLSVQDPSKALGIFNDSSLAYENSTYIGFNIVRKDLAKKLEAEGIKVFWFET